MIKSVKMTKKSIFRDQFSWKVRNFASVFLQHIFLLLNFSLELRPRKRFYEQDLTSIGVCASSADSSVGCKGCRRPEWIYGWGLRFLYAFELVLSPQNLDERINNKYKIQ